MTWGSHQTQRHSETRSGWAQHRQPQVGRAVVEGGLDEQRPDQADGGVARAGKAQHCPSTEHHLDRPGIESAGPVDGLDNLWFGVPLRCHRRWQGDAAVAKAQGEEVVMVRTPLPEPGVTPDGRSDDIGKRWMALPEPA